MAAKFWLIAITSAALLATADPHSALAQRLTEAANDTAEEGDEPAVDESSDDDSQQPLMEDDDASEAEESAGPDFGDQQAPADAAADPSDDSVDATDISDDNANADLEEPNSASSDAHSKEESAAEGDSKRLRLKIEANGETDDASDEAGEPTESAAPRKMKGKRGAGIEPAQSPIGKQPLKQKDLTETGKRPPGLLPNAKSSNARPQPKREEVPRTLQDPGAKAATTNAGKSKITQAFVLTKTADDEPELTQIIELCQAGMEQGLHKENAAYARRLMAWAHNRRGELQADAGNATASRKDFEAAVALDPKHWRAVHNRGVSYAGAGELDAAIADFDRALQLNPKFANGYFNRGELRYDKGEFEKAIADYTEAIRLNPKDSGAYNSRGHANYRLNRFRPALSDYGSAIRIEPQNAAAYTKRGDAQADLGSYAEAVKDYQMAVKINPRLGRAYQSAAWLMATCPDPAYRDDQQAVEIALKAIELDGDELPLYLETLAAAQANAGQFAEAAQTQQRAVEMIGDTDRGRAQRRLALYKKRNAFRDSVRAGATANAPKRPQRPAPR